jgi:hypothetical protein
MSSIQSGSNWWIDSVSRFSGGDIATATRGAAATALAAGDPSDDADSLSSAISDEEDGEVAPANAGATTETSLTDLAADEVDDSSVNSGISPELVATTAMQLGVIESAMRQHQATGSVPFTDDDTDENASDDESSQRQDEASQMKVSLLGDILQNPFAALAGSTPSLDRLGIYSLLGTM